jgi:hypothetical protein
VILTPLQRVIHTAARGLRPHNHVIPTLKQLHWLPIAQRVDYKLCLLIHEAVIGEAPTYLTDLMTAVTEVPPRSALRDASNGDFFRAKDTIKTRSEGLLRRRTSSLESTANRSQRTMSTISWKH